jgi:hypothetical protein
LAADLRRDPRGDRGRIVQVRADEDRREPPLRFAAMATNRGVVEIDADPIAALDDGAVRARLAIARGETAAGVLVVGTHGQCLEQRDAPPRRRRRAPPSATFDTRGRAD